MSTPLPVSAYARKRVPHSDEQTQKDSKSLTVQNEETEAESSSRIIGNCVVPGNAYATCSIPIKILNGTSLFLSYYWWHCLDHLLAIFIRTTEQRSSSSGKGLDIVLSGLKGVSYLVFLILLIPSAVLSFLIWFPLQYFRPRPFSYHISNKISKNLVINLNQPSCDVPDSPCMKHESCCKSATAMTRMYTVVTSNVCLMPEFLARLNNVSNTVKRAERVWHLLCGETVRSNEAIVKSVDESGESNCSHKNGVKHKMGDPSVRKYTDDGLVSISSNIPYQREVASKENVISEHFPNCDFLCLQEVFDPGATDVLLKGLSSEYPHILYDVSWPLENARLKLLNSGLCIASKFPFMNVDFKAFPDGFREDKLACKGLLMTKVCLGESNDGGTIVGYLATTHLQAITHSKASEVRCKQLNLLQAWLDHFKVCTKGQRDIVLFDIICGDFNFDQESHFEENERKCEFRTVYKDPCVDETGRQHDWVIGTELKAERIHDPSVNYAKGLQRMVLSESERPQYVASTIPTDFSHNEESNGKRRIDYILYQDCVKKMVIKDYKFITGFAALTDHIPVTMSFSTTD